MKNIIVKVLIILLVIASVAIALLVKQKQILNKKVSDQAINLKALDLAVLTLKGKSGELYTSSMLQNTTIAELTASKDSISTKVLKLTYDNNIKQKDLETYGFLTTKLQLDTVFVPYTVTKYVNTDRSHDQLKLMDTTYDLSFRPHIIETISFKHDSISRHLEVYNMSTFIGHMKKETIEPRKKFFLTRLFQKKQKVVYIDVINSNPFLKSTNQKFVVINK